MLENMVVKEIKDMDMGMDMGMDIETAIVTIVIMLLVIMEIQKETTREHVDKQILLETDIKPDQNINNKKRKILI